MRGVGHELALAGQHVLGLGAGVGQRPEHPLQRAGQLGHLVVGLGLGDLHPRVTGALDVSGRLRELSDRSHRPPRDHQPGQQRAGGAAQHPEHEQQAHVRDRGLHVRDRAGVLHEHLAPQAQVARAGLDQVAVDLLVGQEGQAQVGRAGGLGDRRPIQGQHADDGVLAGGVEVEVGHHAHDPPVVVDSDHQPVAQVVGGGGGLVLEVRADPVGGQASDEEGEHAQDEQGQQRRRAGQAPADRQPATQPRQERCAMDTVTSETITPSTTNIPMR